eukprot:PhF_6_TR7980/c2_g3_i4/m.12205
MIPMYRWVSTTKHYKKDPMKRLTSVYDRYLYCLARCLVLTMWGGVGVSHVAPFLEGVWHRVSSVFVPMSPFVILVFWRSFPKVFLTVGSCILACILYVVPQWTRSHISNVVYFILMGTGLLFRIDAIFRKIDDDSTYRTYSWIVTVLSIVLSLSGPLSLRTPTALFLQTVLVPSLVDICFDVEDEVSLRYHKGHPEGNTLSYSAFVPPVTVAKICVKSLIWNGVMGMGVLCGTGPVLNSVCSYALHYGLYA